MLHCQFNAAVRGRYTDQDHIGGVREARGERYGRFVADQYFVVRTWPGWRIVHYVTIAAKVGTHKYEDATGCILCADIRIYGFR